MDCKNCKYKNCDVASVSLPYHVLSVEKENAIIKSQRIAIIGFLIFIIVNNLLWAAYCSKFEKVTETTTETYTLEGIAQNADGNNYLVGGDMYGKPKN